MFNFILILIIHVAPGVTLRLPGQLEVKHFSTDQIIKAGVALAKRLGGSYWTWEEAV